ncbi:Na+/H+ antiporter subunit E [Falsirhodobacter halotolerans]|uniref:Na+/H+ antiporter subunit E n=1 Tax=Falsirhodobacter halotolerans TaxID=1146892 RepID=UPI001FD23B7F|nr:Na+/H+ antiporter subunit E [Falsirhodobacter halotolerans]MCJ8139204.1 Na+/H+ antiporter subunit E [Falsirhodobacter halotolerans]
MKRVVPHPIFFCLLLLMWMILTRFSLGQLILGSAVSAVACRALSALEPKNVTIRRWRPIPRLIGVFLMDMAWSNLQVARVILGRRQPRSSIVEVPLDTRDRAILAIMSIIITATPGTAWLGWNPRSGILLMHVFDLEEEEMWRDLMKTRYEKTLREIFE